MALGTSNRDGGRTSESGHLRAVSKIVDGHVIEGLEVTQRGAGANMSVDISEGDAFIPRADGSYAHPVFNDAVYNQAIGAADGSNPRRDIVVIYIDYNEAPTTGVSNNTNGVVKITVVQGTPAGAPTDPTDMAIQSAVGSGNPYIKLARIRVAAGATSISNANIDDMRTLAYARDGGGWNPLSAAWDTWQFSAWNATYRTATITVADSSIFNLGQRVRYWQQTGGWKYGIITSRPNGTSITVFQGNSTSGYTLNNERIYLPAYSRDKTPDGFPSDPIVWTLETLGNNFSVSNPPAVSGGTWAASGFTLNVPIGKWELSWSATIQGTGPNATVAAYAALHTSASVPAPSPFSTLTYKDASGQAYGHNHVSRLVDVASNSTYQVYVGRGAAVLTSIIVGSPVATQQAFIRAVCAYL